MRVSLNSLQNIYQHLQTGEDATAVGAEALETKIGAQLAGMDEVIKVGNKYKGAVIAKVVSCEVHPNADKLHICLIDDGGAVQNVERNADGLVQVVCGAPNVAAGLSVVWLPPGATVPETVGKEEFVLGSRELRGVMSNGMLASPKELDFGDSHEGLLIVDNGYPAGTNFGEATGLAGDTVFDIENKMFTHRPDGFGLLGVAREVAGIQGMSFKSPDWYSLNAQLPQKSADLPLNVQNDTPELSARFSALTIADVKVGASPLWLQAELVKAGIRPINNLVDLGNYIMLLTAQPVHIYDYDKVKAASEGEATIVVRPSQNNEQLTLLNGKTVTPRDGAILIATNKQAIGLAGVMGGAETEVSSETTNIIIEVATFDMYSIRRTSMEHGIFSDAVTRFTKGQSPLQTLAVMNKLVSALLDLAGGQVASELIDVNHAPEALSRGSLHESVAITAEFINQRLGSSLTADQISTLLTNVEFKVEASGNELKIAAPFWRTDIQIREDIVEEVGRLYGYDNLPQALPRRSIKPINPDRMLVAKQLVRDTLTKAGANEVLTYSFVHGNLLDKAGLGKDNAFALSNALSPDLQYYRTSLVPSLLDKVHANIKAGHHEFAIFEIGKPHSTLNIDSDTGLPAENDTVALVVAANDKLKKPDAAYYQAKKYLETLAGHFGATVSYQAYDEQGGMFAKGRSAVAQINGQNAALIGELSPAVRQKLKLPEYSACFELDLSCLQTGSPKIYQPLSKFPSVTQDITLRVSANTRYADLHNKLSDSLESDDPENSTIELSPVSIYQAPDNKDHKNITWRISVTNYQRTLTDDEVNALLENAAAQLKELGAERV